MTGFELADLWCWKLPLYHLSHSHCPAINKFNDPTWTNVQLTCKIQPIFPMIHCMAPRQKSMETQKLKKQMTLKTLKKKTPLMEMLSLTSFKTSRVMLPFGADISLNGFWLTRQPNTKPEPESEKAKKLEICRAKPEERLRQLQY